MNLDRKNSSNSKNPSRKLVQSVPKKQIREARLNKEIISFLTSLLGLRETIAKNNWNLS